MSAAETAIDGFELRFGHFVAGQRRLWPLVLAWLALGPIAIRWLRSL